METLIQMPLTRHFYLIIHLNKNSLINCWKHRKYVKIIVEITKKGNTDTNEKLVSSLL